MMARVGIVTTWFERGAAIVSRQLRDALTRDGMHNVYIYARGEKYARGSSDWDGDHVHWAKRLMWPGPVKIDRDDFESWVRQHNLDIVIFNEQRWWQPLLWLKDMGVRSASYVDYYREDDVEAFAAYDMLICNTRRHLSAFAWHHDARYIPWGTDTELFTPQDPGKRPVTFFHSAGWATHRKGTDLLLKAWSQRDKSLGARLVIHSQADLGELEQWLDEDIEVIRETVPAPGLYHAGDVYIYPTRLEGIGLTICEAISCGLPVITTDEAPMNEFVTEGSTGALVPVRQRYRRDDGYYWRVSEVDIGALTSQIDRFSALPAEELAAMRHEARAAALRHFDWFKNVAPLAAQLDQVTFRPMSPQLETLLAQIDRRTRFGILDPMITSSVGRALIQPVMNAYRKWRQPDLYR